MDAGADYVVRTRVHSGKWTTITARWPLATSKKIEKGDIVTLDLIGWYRNYAFDVLRTAVVGKPDDKQRDILDKSIEVIENQTKAIRPGITAEELNDVVINFSKKIGYEKYISPFGHGIGIEVVENPYILAGSKTILQQGMILCIEPRTTIPDVAGVCIEDEVLVTETGVSSYKGSKNLLVGYSLWKLGVS
jgi:Xaa-Pro aminopeptidase